MRIVIDMQGAQTESRYRGIGRYTTAFAKALLSISPKEHEIFLVLNGLFSATIEPIRKEFDGLLPQDNIRVWHAPGPVAAMEPRNDARRQTAELIREAFIAQLEPDIVHISSLFEGYQDDAVISLRKLDQRSGISVSFYDLIPYLNPKQYLDPLPLYAKYYLDKIDQIQRANIGLAISEHARQESIEHLPEFGARVTSVSTAADDNFKRLHISPEEVSALQKKWNLKHPFVMYTGGTDQRKNLPRLLQAYASLPENIRQKSQLLFAGKFPSDAINEFKTQAKNLRLSSDEIIFTGYVNDAELVQLYNLCHLFVFPSWQEGFGLPALEAMACGAVVIAANTSSLPEVVGLQSALFDPFDIESIAGKVQQAMQDETYRAELKKHSLTQVPKFAWDTVARRALNAWTQWSRENIHPTAKPGPRNGKPRLAYVSPLPPERTGIADYSAELLPALAAHYDIELIVAQNQVELTPQNFPVRDVNWLREHPQHYDRVLYQIGNSPYHQHMLSLVKDIPGMVVLHDFYQSGLISWLENHGGKPDAWKTALLNDHGYMALQRQGKDPQAAYFKYPVNAHILQHAQGLVVHSQHARQLIEDWYGPEHAKNVKVVPLLRKPAQAQAPEQARKDLGLDKDDFVVCSFGFLDVSKLNHRLLKAWIQSKLSKDTRCKLVFVGQNEGGQYGAELIQTIQQSGRASQIQITGFASTEQYRKYLDAADTVVQLRTTSRGETSAAALDGLNHGKPLIVNAHGSMAELNPQAVWMLPDEFEDKDLIEALETMWQEPARRHSMGQTGKQDCQERHAPGVCAAAYAAALEAASVGRDTNLSRLIQTIASQLPADTDNDNTKALAQSLAMSFPCPRMAKRIYLDVTATRKADRKTGIERVTRALMLALMQHPPAGYLAEPVYLQDQEQRIHYRHARRYTLEMLEHPHCELSEDQVEPQQGDILLILDLSGQTLVDAQQSGLYESYRQQGVAVHAIVYDLLPVRMPEVFPPGAEHGHASWLKAISTLDGAVSISRAVRDDLTQWQAEQGIDFHNRRPFKSSWFHLGADLEATAPTKGKPDNAQKILAQLQARPTFLMVGTIEPRKGHMQVIQAFNQMWADGQDINLVIVGREGWVGLNEALRRDIPHVVEQLRSHPENDKHLFWLEGISDEYLENIYAVSTCLIAASWGEGFGLPLIEAARHQLPILARDIPIFREVAGPHASYFDAADAHSLILAIHDWLNRGPEHVPQSREMPQLSWKQSVQQLIAATLPGNR